MQSNKANAVWASQTSSQTVGVNNWTQYQLSLTGSSYKFQINSAATTSTNLQYYTNREGVNITSGDSILLSTNGTSFTSGTAGAVTFVGATATQLNGTGWTNSGSGNNLTNLRQGSGYISPDGTRLYQVNDSTGSGNSWRVYQFNLSTPFDITTASWSGNQSFSFVDNYGPGITFKPDGTMFFVSLYNGSTTLVRAYALSTAWDISTASSTVVASVTLTMPSTSGNWTNGVNYGFISFSPDGTKLIGSQIIYTYFQINPGAGSYGQGNFGVYDLSVPWVLSTCATTTTNWSNVGSSTLWGTGSGCPVGFWMSPDGYTLTAVFKPGSSTTGPTARTIVLGSPYAFGNGGTSYTANATAASGSFTAASAPSMIAYFNASGSQFTYNEGAGGNRALSTGNDLYGKYNVNISGFGLGSAPTFAYNAAPTVRVDAESTSGRINMFPYQVYQASSTTSQAVLYKPTSGYLAANDTVLLNGTTSVTLSSVTEGTNLGVAAVPITTAANRTYSGKSLVLSNSSADYCYRISPDGATLIVGLRSGFAGAGLYQYTLATPWDINTAVFANQFVAITQDNTTFNSGNNLTIPFDISPDGTRMWLLNCYPTGSSTAAANMTVREYTLNPTWNITAIRPTGVTWTNSSYGLGRYTGTCIRFVPNGSQFVVVINDIGGSGNMLIVYRACSTPYLISTAATGSVTWYTVNGGFNIVRSVVFTPDGANIITQGETTTSNTITTPNNMATATQTNDPSTPGVSWAWPSGTASSAAYNGEFSPDGTKYYVINGTSSAAINQTIWQMNVMVIPQTSYTCNFATQGSAPTSVVVPDRSVAQTITTTLSGGNMTFAATAQATNARAIATKITAPGNFTTVTNATLSMWRS